MLGLKDVLARKGLYLTMTAVIILASFIMIVPQNLYHTISGDDFVTNIGVGKCDLRMDIQQTGQDVYKRQRITGKHPPEFRRQRESCHGPAVWRRGRIDCIHAGSAL